MCESDPSFSPILSGKGDVSAMLTDKGWRRQTASPSLVRYEKWTSNIISPRSKLTQELWKFTTEERVNFRGTDVRANSRRIQHINLRNASVSTARRKGKVSFHAGRTFSLTSVLIFPLLWKHGDFLERNFLSDYSIYVLKEKLSLFSSYARRIVFAFLGNDSRGAICLFVLWRKRWRSIMRYLRNLTSYIQSCRSEWNIKQSHPSLPCISSSWSYVMFEL